MSATVCLAIARSVATKMASESGSQQRPLMFVAPAAMAVGGVDDVAVDVGDQLRRSGK